MAPPPHQSTAPANSSSTTQTQHDLPTTAVPGVLRLRAEPPSADSRRIRWAEDVIDNEGMGKKKSKVCCIYHKAREVGESSSESEDDSSSSSSSDSDSDENDDGSARMGKGEGKGNRHNAGHGHGHGHGEGGGGGEGRPRRKRAVNAYEKEHGHGHGHGHKHRRGGEKDG